jgi:hypothetical protein
LLNFFLDVSTEVLCDADLGSHHEKVKPETASKCYCIQYAAEDNLWR